MTTDLTSPVLRWLIEASWLVTLLVLLVLVAELTLGSMLTPRWRYGLWLLVVARLAVPWSPEVDAGLLRWKVESVTRPFPAWIDTPRTAPAPVTSAPVATTRPRAAAPSLVRAAAGPVVEPAAHARRPDPALAIAAVWALGALLLLGRDLWREWLFRRRLADATPLADDRAVALLDSCRREIGVRRLLALETDLVASPAVFGLVNPRLLLPRGLVARLSTEELRPVLRHELFHVRHGDVPANLAFTVLRAAFWFHPLVHLALRRLRDARESVRDWEALSDAPPRSSHGYARTLLELASSRSPDPSSPALGIGPRGRDLKRRILMIAAFDHHSGPSRHRTRATVAGVALVAGLGWVTFTQAAPPTVLATLPGADQAPELKQVVCERETTQTPLRAELERKLDETVGLELRGATIDDAIAFLRAAAGLNVVLMPDVHDWVGDLELNLVAGDIRVRDSLALLCRTLGAEMGYAVATDGVLVIGRREELPQAFEMRFYRLDPFLRDLPPDARTNRVHEIINVTTMHTGEHGEWDRASAAIDYWNGLLVITQTDEMHAEVLQVLNLLLNRGRREDSPAPTWRAALERQLETSVSVEYRDEWIGDVVASLQAAHGVPILVSGDSHAEISLTLSDVPLRTVLEWIGRQAGLRVGLEAGAVVLVESVRPHLEIYEIGDLIAPLEGGTERDHLVQLVDLMRQNVDPESWDLDPRYSVCPSGDLLLVRQSEDGHAGIHSMLETMRRALRRDR